MSALRQIRPLLLSVADVVASTRRLDPALTPAEIQALTRISDFAHVNTRFAFGQHPHPRRPHPD